MSNLYKRILKLVMILVLSALAYFVFDAYQTNLNTKHAQRVPEFVAAGSAFGEGRNKQACLDETFRQNTGCTDFSCGVYYGKFFKACVEVASPSVEMCQDVPKFTEKKNQESKDWLRDVCFEKPEANTCRLLMRQVQLQCNLTDNQ